MKPLLVIVSGPPAAGKTTIARALGPRLGVPVLCRDDLKESLFGSLGWSDRAWSQQLGGAAFELVWLLLDRLLCAGVSVVVEANFWVRHREIFLSIEERAPFIPFEVYCWADAVTLRRRFAARILAGERHAGHVDQVNAVFTDEWVRERHPPLRLGEHCMEVNTAREVDLDSLVAAIEAVRMTSFVGSRREVT
jgi:predicted kinase